MRTLARAHLLPMAACLAFAASPAWSAGLACDFVGNLYDVNLTTGAATNQRLANLPPQTFFSDLAYTQGNYYAVTTFGGSPENSLVRVNPTNAAITTIGSLGLTFAEGDLAVKPSTGELYALEGGARSLLKINLVTGAATSLGVVGITYTDPSGLAFTPSGRLYTVEMITKNLLEIDPGSGAILSTTAINMPAGAINSLLSGLEWDPQANTFAFVTQGLNPLGSSQPSLYHLDPDTAQLTFVGDSGVAGLTYGFSGLAITVPEPASLALALLAAPSLLLRKSRRKSP